MVCFEQLCAPGFLLVQCGLSLICIFALFFWISRQHYASSLFCVCVKSVEFSVSITENYYVFNETFSFLRLCQMCFCVKCACLCYMCVFVCFPTENLQLAAVISHLFYNKFDSGYFLILASHLSLFVPYSLAGASTRSLFKMGQLCVPKCALMAIGCWGNSIIETVFDNAAPFDTRKIKLFFNFSWLGLNAVSN